MFQGVSGRLSGSERRRQPPLPFLRTGSFSALGSTFILSNIKGNGIKCECNCEVLVKRKGKDNTCHQPHVSFCQTKALVDRVVSFLSSFRSSEKEGSVTNVHLEREEV